MESNVIIGQCKWKGVRYKKIEIVIEESEILRTSHYIPVAEFKYLKLLEKTQKKKMKEKTKRSCLFLIFRRVNWQPFSLESTSPKFG